MGRAWQKFDFEGGGLQTANLALARALKKRPLAYALWLLFPLGAPAFYLQATRHAAAEFLLSLAVLVTWLVFGPPWAWIPSTALAAFGLYDLWWIDKRLVTLNKEIRMRLYLRRTEGAPQGFKGHYTDEVDLTDYTRTKEAERAGHPVRGQETAKPTSRGRAPSFSQQEALLRELAKKKRD